MSRLLWLFFVPLVGLTGCATTSANEPNNEWSSSCRTTVNDLNPIATDQGDNLRAWKIAYAASHAYGRKDFGRAATQWRKLHVLTDRHVYYWNAVLALAKIPNIEHTAKLLEELDANDLPDEFRDDYRALEDCVRLYP
jgi:hypothetical protein